jgi:hypothetical protein
MMNLKSTAFLLVLMVSFALHDGMEPFTNPSKCYDNDVYSAYYGATPELEDFYSGFFYLPASLSNNRTYSRLFLELYPWERNNLWNRSTRTKRYEAVSVNIDTLARYKPAQIQAMRQEFLYRAPDFIKSSILFKLLEDWIPQGLDINTTISEISNAYYPRDHIIDAPSIINTIKDITKLPSTAPDSLPSYAQVFFENSEAADSALMNWNQFHSC